MKYNNIIAGLIVIGLILLTLSICKIIYGKEEIQKRAWERKVEIPKHSVERIKEIIRYRDSIGIFCIDGYKWVVTASSVHQFFIINNKGQVVPARCE